MAQPILKIRGVTKRFGKKLVLNDINLDIYEGELFGIIGVSGAGKTTLLEALVGFIPLNRGEVSYRIDGHSVFEFLPLSKAPQMKKEIGFSTQDPSFYDRLTVKENLAYFATLYNIPKQFVEQRIKKIMTLVELTGEENTLAGELSGGEQKRLDIACSLVNDPKIIIFDEPTANLDPVLRKHIGELIRKIKTLGKTVIVSSHFLEEIGILCDRLAILDNTVIAHIGTIDELRKGYGYDKEIVLHTASRNYPKITRLLKEMPITKAIVRGTKMIIYTKQPERVLKKLADILEKEKEDVFELSVHRPSVEEIFVSLIRQKGAP